MIKFWKTSFYLEEIEKHTSKCLFRKFSGIQEDNDQILEKTILPEESLKNVKKPRFFKISGAQEEQ